jgi:ATP-dependent Zn protease
MVLKRAAVPANVCQCWQVIAPYLRDCLREAHGIVVGRKHKLSRRQRLTEEATAFHEAGHAVTAHVLGVGMRKAGVSILPESDSAGRCYARR